MTTYRKVKPASSMIETREWDDYEQALAFSRSIGGHKPIRHVAADGLRWRVLTPTLGVSRPQFVRVKPAPPVPVPGDVLSAVLAELPDIAGIKQEQPAESDKQPDSYSAMPALEKRQNGPIPGLQGASSDVAPSQVFQRSKSEQRLRLVSPMEQAFQNARKKQIA